ncbi:hypothetical protein [Rufibacter psychrotolerans]|uniref:hypothetical protein n=1 Tax=Rufibacter psychrotolerans TaxID=2812556 RepID=UPI001967FADD|nr:hypothetical protein [Rufibacter sp. SYSU D00308]
MRKLLLTTQGIFYTLTGLWPLLHRPGFLAVTGPKNEVWLVDTVGVLVLAIGAGLLTAAFRKERERGPELIGFFCAVGLGAMDVRYATREVILDIYLLDAAAEALLALAWIWVFFKTEKTGPEEKT